MKQITWQEAFERMFKGEEVYLPEAGPAPYRWRNGAIEYEWNGEWVPSSIAGAQAMVPWYIKEEPVEFKPGDWITVNSEGCIVKCDPPQAIGRLSKRYWEVPE